MKKKAIITTGLLLALALTGAGCGRKQPITSIRSFTFSFDSSTMANAYTRYEVSYDRKTGVHTATVKPDGVPEADASVYVVDDAFLMELAAFLHENNVEKWDGFQKSDRNVMDGNGFQLSVWTHEDVSVSASGYMKWPKNYSEVKGGIIRIFGKLQ